MIDFDIENILCIGGVITLTGMALYLGISENQIVAIGIGGLIGYLAKTLTTSNPSA